MRGGIDDERICGAGTTLDAGTDAKDGIRVGAIDGIFGGENDGEDGARAAGGGVAEAARTMCFVRSKA